MIAATNLLFTTTYAEDDENTTIAPSIGSVDSTCNFKLCTSSNSETAAFYAYPHDSIYGGIAETNIIGRQARESCKSTAAGRDQLWPICDKRDTCVHGIMYSWTSSGCDKACEAYNVVNENEKGYNDWSLKTGKEQGETSKGIKAWA